MNNNDSTLCGCNKNIGTNQEAQSMRECVWVNAVCERELELVWMSENECERAKMSANEWVRMSVSECVRMSECEWVSVHACGGF